ncbi:hypothetical protein IV498_08065 [Paenarthrobacter sp. Z7-10]|uniref:hypothetical protein n=1 Tax=Paenarthrobacter sp. Z7-10 TaxID=2787635 RepID=UPI0022A97DCE|nr:hypothetical protein [Paenarthrobacter sp. Z7-10]MCZ2403138.1 hypothetical protein [Paenarthrobacter sp. Z7-10]
MSSSNDENAPDLDGVIESHDDALPGPTRSGHGKMPERLDDDALAAATEQERVDAGLEDYAPNEVPPATDPLPPGTNEAVDRAQRGLTED